MDDRKEAFDDYIEKLKKVDLNSKKYELFDSLGEFLTLIDNLARMENINLYYLNSKEIGDLYKSDHTEDDFVEAILVYVEVIKDALGQYLTQKEDSN